MKGNPEIKNWYDGNIIVPAGKYSSLKEAVEREKANLSEADLSWANLSEADLKKIPNLNTPTLNEYIEKFKIEKEGEYIYLFKGVTSDLESPQSSVKIKYTPGIHKVDFADCDVWQDCSYGISLSPTEEAAKEWGNKIIRVKVHIGDISCIPVCGYDKKIRVKKCEVTKEKDGR